MAIRYYPDKLCHFRPKLIDTTIASSNNTQISRSKIDNRMLYFKGVAEDIDTLVYASYPDSNYSKLISLTAYTLLAHSPYGTRFLLVCPKNKILNLYCFNSYPDPVSIAIYEVDPSTFKIKTVTWNTQPELGNKIGDFSFLEGNWVKINTGNSGAIEGRIESMPPNYQVNIRSTNYDDKDYRPYFTNE